MEHEKRREYGLGAADPSALFDGVAPVTFEQHGCPEPLSCIAHFAAECRDWSKASILQTYTWDCVHDSILRTVCPHLLHPVCYALSDVPRECCPTIQVEDRPRERSTSRGIPLSANSNTWSQSERHGWLQIWEFFAPFPSYACQTLQPCQLELRLVWPKHCYYADGSLHDYFQRLARCCLVLQTLPAQHSHSQLNDYECIL